MTLQEVAAVEDEVAVAAITAAELLVGLELGSRKVRARRAFLDELFEKFVVEIYDLEVARAHAALLAHARRTGRARGAHDLIIAATAVARDREVVTTDPKAFEDLPGVRVRASSA